MIKRFLSLLLLASLLIPHEAKALSYGSLLGAGGAGVPAYTNLAAFPASATTGSLAVDQASGVLYVYFSGSWQVVGAPGVITTMGALNGQAKNAQAGTVSGNTIYMQSADAAFPGVLTAADWSTFNAKLSSALTNSFFFVGNGANVATGVSMSGDATLANTGAVTIANSAVTSAKILDGTIVDADINAAAAISFSKLAALTNGNILVGSAGNVAASVAMSGDATIVNSGALTVANNAISDAKLRDSSALSVIGRSVNSAGDPADIAAGADFNILRRSGVTVGFGAIDLSQAGAVGASIAGLPNGGTNKNMTASNGAVAYSDADSLELSAVGSAGQIFRSAGAGAPVWSTATYPSLAGAAGNVLRSDGTNFLSALLAASDVGYTPASTANWLVDPVTVAAALDNLANAKIGALWYVSRSVGVDSASCGMILNPCLTISQALTNMGPAASAADVKKPQTVLIEGGSYDESLTIPDGRIVNLIGMGTVVLGDGAGVNWASTVARSIDFSPTNAGVFGSDIKPGLTIGSINPSDTTSTFLAESNGFFISGNIALNGSGISHTLNLFGVKLAGSMTKTSAGLTNIQAYRSYFVGALNLSSGSTVLERIRDCQFDSLITVDSYNYFHNSEIKAGMTTATGLVNNLPPNGMYDTTFTGTFTGPAASLKLDLASDFFFRANGASLAGGATKVIISPYATAAIDGILSSTDWSTFNNKQPAGNYITDLTGDVTASGPGSVAATIANDAVSDAKLRNSAALSVIGRSVNSAGDPADIAAGADFNILRRSGVTIGFGALDLSQAGAVGASVLGVANGGYGTDIQEVPAGAVNNVNVTFTLSQTPASAASVMLHQDGLILNQGVDYTIASATITMTVAPNFAQKLYAVYRY